MLRMFAKFQIYKFVENIRERKGKKRKRKKKLSLIHFITKQNIKCPKNWKSNDHI
jgi:hypothetical protein